MPNQFDRRRLLAIISAAVVICVAGLAWWTTREAPAPTVATTAVSPGAAAVAPTGATATGPGSAVLGDIVLGDDAAPVTVIEYASFTCPHCAAFHADTWPQFKLEYIDTGKVRFILREVYFDREGLWASMTARCGGADAFYPMAEQFMEKQSIWAKAARGNNSDEIRKIGLLNGLSAAQFDACFSDQGYADALIEAYQRTTTADGVESTPTFIINGALHAGNMPFDEFSALIDAAL